MNFSPDTKLPEIAVFQAANTLDESQIDLAVQYTKGFNIDGKVMFIQLAIASACGEEREILALPDAVRERVQNVLHLLAELDSAGRFEYARRLVTAIESEAGYRPAISIKKP